MQVETTSPQEDYQVNIETDKSTRTHAVKCTRRQILILVVVIILLVIIIGAVLGTVLSEESSKVSEYRLAEHPLILVSFDGFRAEYLKRGLTPHFNNFASSGVQADFMLSSFPTKTFPNHYTIATGLFPESHGIVFNNFYDPKLRRKFTIRSSRYAPFWGGEPIWMTAKKSGMKSASYYWVGSEIKGLQPTYYKVYNQSVPASVRIDQVIKWLQLPKQDRPSFITLYFHEPDYTGHGFGPVSKELDEQLKTVDGIFGDFLEALNKIEMSNSVNVVLVSDHGMSYFDCKNTVFLDKYGVSENKLYWNNLGLVGSFTMKKKDENLKTLNKIKCVNDSFQAFNKRHLPKRMHFSNNRRIDEIIVISDQGKTVGINSSVKLKRCFKGSHGNDNILPEMQTIFMARGPSFKKNKVVKHFSNIEIYNLLAALLKITPAPNNGTLGSLNSLLVNDSKQELSRQTGDGNEFRSDVCQFPQDDKTFNDRNKCCNCSADCAVANVTVPREFFNVSSKQAQTYQDIHLPWGVPEGGASVEGCLLSQDNLVVGYSTYLRIPLWVASRVNSTASNVTKESCIRFDVRLPGNQSENCKSYTGSDFVMGSLHAQSDEMDQLFGLTTTATIVPQYPSFNTEIWYKLEGLVQSWSLRYKNVYVISGSIFDGNNDGIKDDDKLQNMRLHGSSASPAIPTHFYKIITRCLSSPVKSAEYQIPSCNGSLQSLSFILRNTNESCKSHDWQKTLLLNVARIKDIELLTGTNFFPNLPAQLQTEIKTFLPVELWS